MPRGVAAVAVVAAGGALGALARHGAGIVWPTAPGTFPTTTFAINVVGSALIGMLLALIAEARRANELVRLFLATGVLGGFTTFSAYTVDTERLLREGRPILALSYAGSTLLAALTAVLLATLVTRRACRRMQRNRR